MTQDQLAEATGRARVTIARLEAGKAISRTAFMAITRALGLDPTGFLDPGESMDAVPVAMRPRRVPDVEPIRPIRSDRLRRFNPMARVPIYDVGAVGTADWDAIADLKIPEAYFYRTITQAVDTRRLFAVEATSDALAPEIRPGDLVLVEEGARPVDGIFLVAEPGGGGSLVRGVPSQGAIGRAIAVLHRL